MKPLHLTTATSPLTALPRSGGPSAASGHRWARLRRLLLAAVLGHLVGATALAENTGTLRIVSGSGDFSAVSASHKTLTVRGGATLSGTVNLHANNIAPSNHIAPLIYTPTWGEPSTSWREINSWIPANESDQQATVAVTVPTTPGVYHVIFAYFWEIGAEHVASGTNWQVGTDNWNDGDEVARYSATQIAQGQANGVTVANHLVPTGSQPYDTPIDAITLVVSGTRKTPFIRGPVAGQPDGVRYLAFGTPQVGAFSATISGSPVGVPAVIGPDGRLLLKDTGTLPALPGSVVTRLGQPSGDAALASLKTSATAQVTAANSTVLLRGLSTGAPQIAARTGTSNAALPAGVTIKSFGTIDGNGSAIFFLATLQGTGVTPKNALALCAALGNGSVKVLARTGDTIGDKKITTLATLAGSAATLAEGRWRVDGTTCGVRVTFNDAAKTQAVYAIPATAASPANWSLLATSGLVGNLPAIDGTTIRSFGLPGFGPGSTAAVIANLAIAPGGPAAANHFALLFMAAGQSATVVARTGDPIATDANGAPLSGVKITSFADPISGADRQMAFVVNGSRPSGIPFKGIMFSDHGSAPSLLANIGAAAPGGGHWASLDALVFPDGETGGPLFLGTLAVRSADGITALTNRGVWSVDSTGTLRLLLRSGQSVMIGTADKTLASFTALTAAPGSVGAASGHDAEGRFVVLATCMDGTRALLTVSVP